MDETRYVQIFRKERDDLTSRIMKSKTYALYAIENISENIPQINKIVGDKYGQFKSLNVTIGTEEYNKILKWAGLEFRIEDGERIPCRSTRRESIAEEDLWLKLL